METINAKEMGLRIKSLRCNKCMTQVELAEKLFYATERQLQRIENGEALCSLDKLVELSRLLDASMEYIVFGSQKAIDIPAVNECICLCRIEMQLVNNSIKVVVK